MPRAHRILTASTGGLAALTLLASPAAASPASSAAQSFPSSVNHSGPALAERSDALMVAAYHATLDAKLDRVAATLLANRAQRDAVGASSVLTHAQRSAALADLFWALRTSRHLAAVPTTGAFAATAAERTQIASLRAGLGTLVGQLRARLDNRSADVKELRAAFSKSGDLRPRLSDGDHRACTHRFDRAGFAGDDHRDGQRDGHRDGFRRGFHRR